MLEAFESFGLFESFDKALRDEAHKTLTATDPVAFFSDNPKRASILYRRLARQFHPDMFLGEGDKSQAQAAFTALAALWEEWNRKLNPKSVSGEIPIDGKDFVIREELRHLSSSWFKAFEIAGHPGVNPDIRVLFVCRAPGKRLEYARLLAQIQARGVCTDLFAKLSGSELLIAQSDGVHLAFTADIPPGQARRYRPLGFFDGFGPLDPKDIAWIWRRIASAAAVCEELGFGFSFGPDLVAIEPETHGLLAFGVDLARIGNALADAGAWMLSASENMPKLMANYFKAVMGKGMGPAAQLLFDYDHVLERLYGSRVFHPFAWPGDSKNSMEKEGL